MTRRLLLAAAIVTPMSACSATPDPMDLLDAFELNTSRYRGVAARYLADPDWSKCNAEAEQLATASNDFLKEIRLTKIRHLSAPVTPSTTGERGGLPETYRTAWIDFDTCLFSYWD